MTLGRNEQLFQEIYNDYADKFVISAKLHPDDYPRTPAGLSGLMTAVSDRFRSRSLSDLADDVALDLMAIVRLGDGRRPTRKLLQRVDRALREILKSLSR